MLGILFSAAVNAVFVAKLLTSGILFSNSVSFVFLTRLLRSEIFLHCMWNTFQCYLLSKKF